MSNRPYNMKRLRKGKAAKLTARCEPVRHWLDRHEQERERHDEALRQRLEAIEREARNNG